MINGNGEVRNQPDDLRSGSSRPLHDNDDDEEIVEDNQRRPRSNMDGPPAPIPEVEQRNVR